MQTTLYVAFGLLPLAGSKTLFGAATTPITLAAVVPAIAFKWISYFLHRRGAQTSGAYRASLLLEQIGMYGCVLVFLYAAESMRTIIWAEQPYAAVLWALNAPALWRRNVVGIIVCSVGLVAAFLWKDDPMLAVVSAASGLLSCAVFGLVTRRRLHSAELEVERNRARADLTAVAVEDKRARVASLIHEHVGEKIHRLASDVQDTEAQALLEMLEDIVRPILRPQTLGALAAAIDEKCQSLCEHYERTPPRDPTRVVDGETALAMLRVAQELVRNAVTHGAATTVRLSLDDNESALELRVSDNGAGLTAEVFAHSQRGLANARAWLTDLGGTLERTDTSVGTSLFARVGPQAPRTTPP